MSARIVPMILSSAFLPALLAAPPTEKAATGDLARLQGEWSVLAGPKGDVPVTLNVRGSEVAVEVRSPLGIAISARGRIRLDDSARPKTVDWVGFTIGDGQDFPEVLGLYELGEGTFKVVNGGPNDARPSEFKKGDGALADVLVFRRVGIGAASK